VPTPVPRPTWLKIAAILAVGGAVAWPVLAMLAIVGVIPAQVVLNVGLVTAFLAYISIRRIKQDRDIAMDASGEPDAPYSPPDDAP
jgi:hypothetical protein